MRREIVLPICLILLIAVMFGFGSRWGYALQTMLAEPIAVGDNNAPELATISQTVSGYGLTNSVSASSENKTIPVYSRYPFNLKNEILIAAGEKDGVEAGDVVLFQGSILGKVQKVFADSALAQTIFDSNFKTAVRIGEKGVDALLVGGPEPKLTLIPADAKVSANDRVYAAAEGWPYGGTLGAVSAMHEDGDNIYRSGTLRVFYNPAALNSVTLLKKS